MLGKSLAAYSVLTFDSKVGFCSSIDSCSAIMNSFHSNANQFNHLNLKTKALWMSNFTSNRLVTHSTARVQDLVLGEEDKKTWDSCREALVAFGFSNEEEDKILGKAFGQIHSPYWGEERKKEVPKLELVNEVLNYLKGLGLTDDDLSKLLKKFPEVLGCSLEDEMKTNVQVLEKEWGIKGKSLRNLLHRNPRVLGYNIDCKGDCMAQCTRCWARF